MVQTHKFLVKKHTTRYNSIKNTETIYHFDTDEDFVNFSIEDDAKSIFDETTGLDYIDYPFTTEYEQAIANHIKFVIDDPTSSIMSKGYFQRGVVIKPIENLMR